MVLCSKSCKSLTAGSLSFFWELLCSWSFCSWSPPEVDFSCYAAFNVLHLVPHWYLLWFWASTLTFWLHLGLTTTDLQGECCPVKLLCRVMDPQLCLAGRDFQLFFDFLLAIANAADYLKMSGSSYLSLIAYIKWVISSQLPEDDRPHLNWHFI